MKYQLLIVVLLGLSLGTAGAGASATNISGTWAFSVSMENPRGPQNVSTTFVFKQEGEKLTGAQGENKVTGTVKGNKVAFSVEGKKETGIRTKTPTPARLSLRPRCQAPPNLLKGRASGRRPRSDAVPRASAAAVG